MPYKKIITKAFLTYNISLVTILNIPDDMQKICTIFDSLAKQEINVDMISQSAPYQGKVSISFSIPSDYLAKTISAINNAKKDVTDLQVEIDAYNSKLSFFGEKMKEVPGVAADLFSLFSKQKVMIKIITTSENDISCLIYEKDTDIAIDLIKEHYDLQDFEIHRF